jgi:uncharacterized membrane protein YeaQ/YmgE (transglycosylase-associated protein family)
MGWNLNLGSPIIDSIITSAIGAAIVVLLAKLLHVIA